MQALIIGFVVMVAYGLFLLIRALPKLYRCGEQKLVYCIVGFTLAAPLLAWLGATVPAERMSIWIALPTLILFGLWVCVGYFVESYRKKREQERAEGLVKRPPAPPGLLRRNALVLAVGFVIWLYGAFIGIGDRNVEIALLCISLFLLTTSISSFWRYRKF